ncbi:response regulator [Sulfitobacter sp. M57]|uniref:response regulator n=1 Tax=unclassified Sulfitobacter TaxID=196795 RepID=UPI0023E28A26|nr:MULTISPECIES: response regulator [unclassified Sulfitobacter]MDF3416067.1 response regulator [Sulfitobacter sp. KE5]MDF3423546.1 response regulator [Sulfitobacter sp. KE43]MDF3434652.1 response regulator [Sulfitobacter sp. KE42]MDF3460252.1 response regulator [Sulfitobacter sp. S74]MDF3464190.1 response regulator [Sulfitobacter sp. Ks18]
MRILAVDDDPIILDLLADCLTEDLGYHLHMYDSAESALEALHETQQPFDCILLDIMLPGMDGIQMCELLRQTTQCYSTPILMITASNEVGLMARAFEAGATDFINKPLKPVELTGRVVMAGLLNQSLAKAQHTMSALSDSMKLRFDEPLDLGVPGMTTILAHENQLLRCSANCFAMSMFTLNVSGLRGIYRTVRSPAFRQCLEIIGATAVKTLNEKNLNLSYVGNGRFFGTVMDRKRMDQDKLTTEFAEHLQAAWDFTQTGVPVPPSCTFSQVSPQRMWSNLSASDKLRDCINIESSGPHLTASEENDLFARLNNKLSEEG